MERLSLAKSKLTTFELPKIDVKRNYLELFERLAAAPDATRPLEKALLIWSTPRCGSTLFTEALNSSKRIGFCDEWFNNLYFKAYTVVMACDFNLAEYWDFVIRKTMGDTGVFTLKWHVGQMTAMHEEFDLRECALTFDFVVYLHRRDKIAQAVSLCRACSSDQYRSYETQQCEPSTTPKAIAKALEAIVRQDEFMRQCFSQHFDAVYTYEDFKQLDTPQTRAHYSYNDVLYALGKEPFSNFHVNITKQSDSTSERLISSFKRYIQGDYRDFEHDWEQCWSGQQTPYIVDRDGSSRASDEESVFPGGTRAAGE